MYPRKTLIATQVATCLGFFVVQLDVSVVNVGLGTLRSIFDASLTDLQWVINSYALIFSALLILGGSCGDKWGAKGTFIFGFVIFSAGSLFCGISNSMAELIAMRCVQGLGAAFMIPNSLTLIRYHFTVPAERRAAVALWGASGGIALAAGPVLGGLMIEYLGWRSIFIVNLPIGLLAVILAVAYLPPSPRVQKGLDAQGQATIAVALGLLTYGLTEASERGFTAVPLWCLVLALVAMVVFGRIERKAAAPMLPEHLWKNRTLLSTMLTGAVVNLTFYGVIFVLSVYFQTVLKFDAFHTGLAFLPLTAIMTISSLLSARIGQALGTERMISIGLFVQMAGFIMLSFLVPGSSTLFLNIALLLIGVGSASTVPAMNNTMLSAVQKSDVGVASGLMASARQVGGVVGVASFGIFISHAGGVSFIAGMSHAMQLCVCALAVAAVFNIAWVRQANPMPA